MSSPAAATLAIAVVVAVLLPWRRWRPEAIAVLAVAALVAAGGLPPARVFSSFGSPVVVTVAAVVVMSAALEQTGAAALLGNKLASLAGASPIRLSVLLMLAAAVLSGFMNNIGAIAVLLPITLAICVDRGLSPAGLLMPLALSTRVGSNLTLIAGPSNLMASALLAEGAGRGFALFEFVPLGAAMVAVTIAFFALFGHRMLPNRYPDAFERQRRARDAALLDIFDIHGRVRQAVVTPSSPLAGRTIADAGLGRDPGVTILAIRRRGQLRLHPLATETLAAHDELILGGAADDRRAAALRDVGLIVGESTASLPENQEVGLLEVVLSPRSSLRGKSLHDVQFRQRYGASVIAIWRHGESLRGEFRNVALQTGDALLLQGPRRRLRLLRDDVDFLLVGQEPALPPRTDRMPVAFAIVAAMIAAVAVGGADVATAALAAAVALVCFGCLSADEAFRRVDWRGLVFIGAMLALGDAMVSTEAAAHTGRFALQVARVPWAGFLGVLGLGVLMNQALPSVAATAVLAPVALQAAERLGANPAAFMMAVVAATGTTFTPVSNPVNLLVMTPGGYTVGDYLRVGAPLAAALFLVSALVIPLVWPLVLR